MDGHAAKAGTNTSGAGGLYPSDVWGLMIGIARVNCCKGGTAALVKAMTTSGPSAISSPAYLRRSASPALETSRWGTKIVLDWCLRSR